MRRVARRLPVENDHQRIDRFCGERETRRFLRVVVTAGVREIDRSQVTHFMARLVDPRSAVVQCPHKRVHAIRVLARTLHEVPEGNRHANERRDADPARATHGTKSLDKRSAVPIGASRSDRSRSR